MTMEASFLISAVRPEQYPPPERPEIAFAGRSNVGKSSLLNCLLGRRKLARTSSTPGRTQTINFFSVNQNLYFVDLPGFGYAKVPLSVRAAWRPMVEDYLTSGRDIRLLILLIDIRREPQEEELNLLLWLADRNIQPLVVATKSDKVKRSQHNARLSAIKKALELKSQPILFSAPSKQGRDGLWEKINEAVA